MRAGSGQVGKRGLVIRQRCRDRTELIDVYGRLAMCVSLDVRIEYIVTLPLIRPRINK
jgi:hypothetical protein